MELTELFGLFVSLGGVAAFITFLINALKMIGIVKDGLAPAWSRILNLVAFLAIWVLTTWFPEVSVIGLNGVLASVAETGTAILLLLFPVAVKVSDLVHTGVRGTPIIGYVHQ